MTLTQQVNKKEDVMRIGKRWLVVFSGLFFLSFINTGLAKTKGGEMTLIENGKPTATIILAQNPTRSAQLAAAELNHYIKKITGVTLPVGYDNEAISGNIVLVGESSFTRALGLENSDFQEQEYLIQTKPNTLILMGYDDNTKGPINYAGNGLWSGFDWFNSKIGSVYAVNDFLRRFCGIRWYLPTELGEVVPKQATLSFSGINLRRKPWTKYREPYTSRMPKSLYWWDPAKPLWDPEKKGWTIELLPQREVNLFWLRHKRGGYTFQANHSFYTWPSRFLETHPEYFALKADGTRAKDQLCYSSEAVVKQIVADAKEWFKGNKRDEKGIARFINSRGDYISLVPMDNPSWCQCPKCQEQLDLKRTRGGWGGFSNGVASNYIFDFVNRVAREFQKELPGKKISALAYWQYYLPPDEPGFKLEPNVSVMLCRTNLTGGYGQLYTDIGYRKEDIERWRELTPNLYFWEYYNFPQYRKHNMFPSVVPRRIAEELRFQHSLGVKGIFWLLDYCAMGVVFPNPAMDHINLYVTLRLADDIDQDVEKILEEYYSLFWGPAAEPMRTFFERMEKIYTLKEPYTDLIEPGTRVDAKICWTRLCPPNRLKGFGNLIKRAKELAKEEPYKSRVELIDNAVYQMMVTSSQRTLAVVDLKTVLPARWVEKAPDFKRGIEDPIWQTTTAAKPFYNAMDTLARVQTQARVLYDKTYLYVLFTCDEPGQIKAEKHPRDSVAIFGDDSVEVFIQLPGDSTYRQFAVNAAGSFYDGKGMEAGWQSTARVWTGRIPQGWWAIFAIPLNELTDVPPTPDTIMPPRPGTLWRINFCRTHPAKVAPERHTSWSPMGGDFHQPQKFGVLQFTKDFNLINNPGFEIGQQGWFLGGPSGWYVSRLDLGTQDRDILHSEKASWRMGRGYIATLSRIDPTQSYRLSVWVRTEDVPDDGVHVWVCLWKGSPWGTEGQHLGSLFKRPLTGGTHNWQEFSFDIDLSREADPRLNALQIFLHLETDKGTVWFDDVRLEPSARQ